MCKGGVKDREESFAHIVATPCQQESGETRVCMEQEHELDRTVSKLQENPLKETEPLGCVEGTTAYSG